MKIYIYIYSMKMFSLVNDSDPGPSRLVRAVCNLLNYYNLKIRKILFVSFLPTFIVE